MLLIHGKPLARHFREQITKATSDPKAKDRFGLPYRPPESEDDAAWRERLTQVRNLVVEAAEAVSRQVGEEEARLLFRVAFQKPPKGKAADDKENAALLVAFDAALARGVPRKRAARVAAGEMIVGEEDPEAIARRIRRLLNRRARDLLWSENFRRANGLPDGLIRPARLDADI